MSIQKQDYKTTITQSNPYYSVGTNVNNRYLVNTQNGNMICFGTDDNPQAGTFGWSKGVATQNLVAAQSTEINPQAGTVTRDTYIQTQNLSVEISHSFDLPRAAKLLS